MNWDMFLTMFIPVMISMGSSWIIVYLIFKVLGVFDNE